METFDKRTCRERYMTNNEKELLLKDLSARLPDKVKVKSSRRTTVTVLTTDIINDFYLGCDVKPYLRPLSSMTKEERDELKEMCADYLDELENAKTVVDKWKLDAKTSYLKSAFYNSHHLDWNGLIEKGLALKAPENMYK